MKQAWVVALLLLPMVLATNQINTAETTVDLQGNKALIHTNIEAALEEKVGNLTLILTQDATSVKINIDGKKINCLLQAEFARCGSLTNGTHTLNISYETTYPVAEVGENTLIRYTDRLPYPAKSQEVTLKLPIGYIIPRERDKDESFYISPDTKEVYSDGQRIILYWKQQGQELQISVIARKVVGLPIAWIITTILTIILAATTTAWFTIRKQPKIKKEKKKKKPKELLPKFIEDEQKVVDIIRKAPNGETWQKQILQETGYSKAKLSRIIRNLEQRQVISKTIYGNTNKISLKK